MVTNVTKSGISTLWNQFETSGTISRMPDQVRPTAMTPSQDRYLTLSARWHRLTATINLSRDLLLRLERGFPA